jgi:hypothetical protein
MHLQLQFGVAIVLNLEAFDHEAECRFQSANMIVITKLRTCARVGESRKLSTRFRAIGKRSQT